ncbi:hypothetical protein NCCP1664_24950 [Zafaria cholistanensis]|uniref:Activator of Hsp90 ATPase homologue 1/2-like C-terminal domain-containing protein n=1 Tax=Zafaria cholistanensis TaxID=1682741 RepID=A0A5A7NSZ7_9MICC|nr:SRPBCC domain-containing protein [Zafaria cholistanensis]GER24000.1 hypothetical protein NCCP1664_24950 [Zafaria cholistanensis]
MDGLFSHASPPPGPKGTAADVTEPLVSSVMVPVTADQAFEGMTEYIHLWWPGGKYSAFGSGTHPAFGPDGLYEEAEDGRRYQWARVVQVKHPELIELSFTMLMDQHPPTRVVIAFEEHGTGTRVTLTHDGWAPGEAGLEQRARYGNWDEILGYYARFMGGK